MNELKKPQDHQAKAEKPKVTKTETGWEIVHRGISLTVLKDSLNDFELLDDVAALQIDEARSTPRLSSMLRRMAGDAGFRAVMDGLRDPETKRVPIRDAVKFIMEIFASLNPNS